MYVVNVTTNKLQRNSSKFKVFSFLYKHLAMIRIDLVVEISEKTTPRF